MEHISVNFAKSTGPIKPMHSVNNGPAGSKVRGTSNAENYAKAGIPFARNHDASFYAGYGGEHIVDVHGSSRILLPTKTIRPPMCSDPQIPIWPTS